MIRLLFHDPIVQCCKKQEIWNDGKWYTFSRKYSAMFGVDALFIIICCALEASLVKVLQYHYNVLFGSSGWSTPNDPRGLIQMAKNDDATMRLLLLFFFFFSKRHLDQTGKSTMLC